MWMSVMVIWKNFFWMLPSGPLRTKRFLQILLLVTYGRTDILAVYKFYPQFSPMPLKFLQVVFYDNLRKYIMTWFYSISVLAVLS